MKMQVEINERMIPPEQHGVLFGGKVLVTPPIDEDYWIMRVLVSEDQAVVAFPKFSTFGIGFQKEEDWNTNLPYACATVEIWEHIRHNKGNPKIKREKCLKAIRMLQEAVAEMRGQDIDAEIAAFSERRAASNLTVV